MVIFSLFALLATASAQPPPCERLLYPREIDAGRAFDDLVDWIERDVVLGRGAPGLVVGVSGTDSIVAFLAVARAFARVGRPERAAAVHFGPADGSDWFQKEMMPWLRERAPGARILEDHSIDHRRDGLRWGALLDWSVLADPITGAMRPPEERFWVVGTRNRSETMLGTYANLSRAASVQPLTRLWKSEVLRVCRNLGVPGAALDRSRVADCTCGREQFPALHIEEVDALLMERVGELDGGWTRRVIGSELHRRLEEYVDGQIGSTAFKGEPPPEPAHAPPARAAAPGRDEIGQLHALIATPSFSGRALAKVVPRLVTEARADVAASLVTSPSPDRDRWLAEALVLMGTPGLRPAQRRRMVETTFAVEDFSTPEVARLARVGHRLANFGFSFARWRFLFKGFDDRPSLAEQFGFAPAAREKSFDLGPGFALARGPWYVEFRQAYVAVAYRGEGPSTLVIRNDSTVFGRDQLPEAAYAAWTAISPGEIGDLSAEKLGRDRRAIPFARLFARRPDLPRGEKLRRLERTLEWLRGLEDEFHAWITGPDGFSALVDLLDHTPGIWLARVEAGRPAWAPRAVREVTPALVHELRGEPTAARLMEGAAPDERLTLMSGPRGDFP